MLVHVPMFACESPREVRIVGGGVSGVSVLAESHITIHTWPARGYAAIDIFMCGSCDPVDCLPELKHRLSPRRFEHQTIRRGRCRPPAGAAQDVA